ncbi:MAG: DUF1730 domain-containing protein [Spirochaetes bacterium]|nr:DUF1730 domain-containing protein [Spirochaetota bacterium]
MTLLTHEIIERLRSRAQAMGFARVAAVAAGKPADKYRAFHEAWLQDKGQSELKYLARAERFNLRAIYPQVQTVILFTYPYRFRRIEQALRTASYKVARYAWQEDYHDVLREKITALLQEFTLAGRAVTDSAPLAERYWARKAGLGFIGRNGLLIDPKTGSYFLIAAALVSNVFEDGALVSSNAQVDVPLTPETDVVAKDIIDFCGECNLCVTACPTQALTGDGMMELTRCISYRTIESHAGATAFAPPEKKHRWIFGCDVCQQVCPYNKTAASYADDAQCIEHSAAPELAAGRVPPARAKLKKSVFFRRGLEKLKQNITAVDAL